MRKVLITMIDYSRINDPEYFKNVLTEINEITDRKATENLLKVLSAQIANKNVNPIEANMLLSALSNRNKVLSNKKQPRNDADYDTANSGGTTNEWQEMTNTQEKKLSLSPTSVSNRSGSISLILIIAGVAITSVMYTLLWIASVAK